MGDNIYGNRSGPPGHPSGYMIDPTGGHSGSSIPPFSQIPQMRGSRAPYYAPETQGHYNGPMFNGQVQPDGQQWEYGMRSGGIPYAMMDNSKMGGSMGVDRRGQGQPSFPSNSQHQLPLYARHVQQTPSSRRVPTETRFNPHAPAFVPSSMSGPPTSFASSGFNETDMLAPPAYANAPMYADNSGFRESNNFYNQHILPQQLHHFLDGDAEAAAYENMYSTAPSPARQFMPSQELFQRITSSTVVVQLQEILVGLEQILADSDELDSFSGAIKERMAEGVMNDEQRNIAIAIMLEMALSASEQLPLSMPASTSDPQASIARLIKYLAREIRVLLPQSVMPALQAQHAGRAELDSQQRLLLLMFFAEVYDRVETATGTKIEKLGEAFCEQATELLKPAEMNDQRMKKIIQAVKLAGPSLDKSAVTRAANDDLLTRLSAFGRGHPQLSESIKTQICHVVEQREAGWGQRNGASSSSSNSSVVAGQIIGVDGRPLSLSEEEKHFLEEAFGGIIDQDEDDQMFAEMENFIHQEDRKQQVKGTEKMLEKLKMCEKGPEEDS